MMDKEIYEGVLDTDEDHHGKTVWLDGKTIENILDEFEGKEIRLTIEKRENVTERKCFDCGFKYEEEEMEMIYRKCQSEIYVCMDCLTNAFISANNIDPI